MTQLDVIQIEGVLANVHTTLAAAKPTDHGLWYYETFRKLWKVALVSAACNHTEATKWLKANRVEKYDLLDCQASSVFHSPEFFVRECVERYRSQGWEVGPVVTGNPIVAKLALMQGVPMLLVAYPAYLRPEHRPDAIREPRPWDTLVEEIEHQREMKSTDTRMEAEDVIGGSG